MSLRGFAVAAQSLARKGTGTPIHCSTFLLAHERERCTWSLNP